MKQSDYQKDANTAKEKLDSVSPSFCLAKWNQVSLHLPTGMTNSCYHPPLHRIDAKAVADNPARLHNTYEKIEQRKQMLSGKRPPGCSYCWKIHEISGFLVGMVSWGKTNVRSNLAQIQFNPDIL